MRTFPRQLVAGLRLLLAFSLLLGVAYPLAFTALAQGVLSREADGSLVSVDGRVVGSALLGQGGDDPAWFASRPSANDHAGDDSGASNLSPVSAEHLAQVERRRAALVAANPHAPGPVPGDALTASASGLDPDISIEYARWQAPRIAQARHLPLERVNQLIDENTTGRTFGVLGQPRVGVLTVNAALAQLPR